MLEDPNDPSEEEDGDDFEDDDFEDDELDEDELDEDDLDDIADDLEPLEGDDDDAE